MKFRPLPPIRSRVLFLAGCLLCLAAASAAAEQPLRKGILLVAFGTSVPEARAAFRSFEAKVRAAFPDAAVRWGYTSQKVRAAEAARCGPVLESPTEALSRLRAEGVGRVAVQSLHVIAGEEFHELLREIAPLRAPGGFERLSVGLPLLASSADARRLSEAVVACAPHERRSGEALVLMGHGTAHPADLAYPALQHFLAGKDPRAFVGTVEGELTVEDILSGLRAKKIRKAWLMPLMTVAGVHVRDDMAGDQEDSWKSILGRGGVRCEPVFRGLAECPQAAELWLAHLKTAWEALDQ